MGLAAARASRGKVARSPLAERPSTRQYNSRARKCLSSAGLWLRSSAIGVIHLASFVDRGSGPFAASSVTPEWAVRMAPGTPNKAVTFSPPYAAMNW
jgi:hypothetical protein